VRQECRNFVEHRRDVVDESGGEGGGVRAEEGERGREDIGARGFVECGRGGRGSGSGRGRGRGRRGRGSGESADVDVDVGKNFRNAGREEG
jgi:hypothetical protein